ncbi:ToMV susceptible protein tm-1(GCR26) [Orobanche hederae]
MNKALQAFLSKAHADRVLAGVIGLGGSGGTSLISSAFRSLPLGITKLIVSTVASGQTEPYVGTSDLVLFPSVVDICGINSKGTVGLTMFGVTTPCINAVTDRLAREGHETLVFHAMGVGGRAMEDLVKGGFIQGVLDISTTEVADYIGGGVMACEASRFDAIIEKKIHLVLGAHMVNFGSKDTIPSEFQQRRIYEHNAQNLLEKDDLSNEDTNAICKSEGLQCFHLGGRKRSRGKEKIGKPYNWEEVLITSGWWKKVISVINGTDGGWFLKNLRKEVGNGMETVFWEEKWLGDFSLKSKFPRLYNPTANKLVKVGEMGLWENDRWVWRFAWIRPLFDREVRPVGLGTSGTTVSFLPLI